MRSSPRGQDNNYLIVLFESQQRGCLVFKNRITSGLGGWHSYSRTKMEAFLASCRKYGMGSSGNGNQAQLFLATASKF